MDFDLDEFLPGPEAEPVLALTFLLELPQCLRITDSCIRAAEPGEPWEGWAHKAMEFSAEFSSIPVGSRPSYAIRIGQARVRGRMPLDAALRTFKDWDYGINSRFLRWRQRLILRVAAIRGKWDLRTTSLVTLFVTSEQLPDDRELFSHSWLLRMLDEVLIVLNQYLVSLAAITDEWQISSITRLDLQRHVPFSAKLDPPVPGWNDFVSGFDAHPYLPNDRPGERPGEELSKAIAMVQSNRSGRMPFFQFLELYQSAEHHLNSGRSGQAVIASCTATEVFVNTLFREAGQALGRSQREIDGTLNCGFSNQLKDHLPKLLDDEVNLDDEKSPAGRWWKHCYDLRNRVVHAGEKPDDQAALDAKASTGELINWIVCSLDDDPRLDHLRGKVPE